MAYAEVWKANHPEEHKEHSRRSMAKWRKNPLNRPKVRAGQLRIRYGLSSEQYAVLFSKQNGVCAVCFRPETAKQKTGKIQRLSVDHNHKCCPGKRSCGKCVRGLLCSQCNIALGYLDDDPVRMGALIAYIKATNQ